MPVYLRDIAEVKDTTEDIRSVAAHQRQARRAHAGHEAVRHEHGADCRRACAREVERINREVPGVKLTVLDDSAKFIERSINAVQEARR